MVDTLFSRRDFVSTVASGTCGLLLPDNLYLGKKKAPEFTLNYITGSCLYGYTDLSEILPEISKTGASSIDIWPKVHGNQREQLDKLGEGKFLNLLKDHNVSLGCITQYALGPFNLKDELRLAQRLGCSTIVTGGKGPKGLHGNDLKVAVKNFVEKMKFQIEVAEETGVKIAIENHSNNLIESEDSLKWLMDFRPSEYLGIALAPYHLPQNEKRISGLIKSLSEGIFMFYAWQHGMGSMEKLPKEQELLQLPGRGSLDFRPILSALQDIKYNGWTEIFMHPVPRGVPIMDSVEEVTLEINQARKYLEMCMEEI
jgi:sugar phosphate isomerase/epimerase